MNNSEDTQSEDEAILDLLSKKTIIDQTEKLVLARFSTKTQTSTEQVTKTIDRLTAKNLIRKIYVQGKIGYEVTPKGKAVLDSVAKAQTERVTRQLQDAINQQRKAKAVASIINRNQLTGEKWLGYELPDASLMAEVLQKAAEFLAIIKQMQAEQPLCKVDRESYDQKFQQYRTKIDSLTLQNRDLTKAASSYAKIKDNQSIISVDIEKINATINKYENQPEITTQINQLKTSLTQLRETQTRMNSYNTEQLSSFEELQNKLAENSKLLETLKKSTHEFAPVRSEKVAQTGIRYQDPEGPVKPERKSGSTPTQEKCIKCDATRRITPVNIG